MSPLEKVIDQMASVGIRGLSATDLIVDGKIHRFSPEGTRKKSGWYVLFDFVTRAGEHIVTGAFGDYRQYGNQKFTVKSDARLDDAERDRMRRETEARRKAAEKRRRDLARRAALRAGKLWQRLSKTGKSPYLARKRVKGYGVRFSPRGALIIPIVGTDGAIKGLQVIHARPRQTKDGDFIEKDFFPYGMDPKGHFHRIGPEPQGDARVVICEGYATGATIHGATGVTVYVAFNAGNLLPVAKAVRKVLPLARILIAADDDYLTTQPVQNPGVTAARKAAKAVAGTVVIPRFSARADGEKLTDFNDLALREGLDVVRQQFDVLDRGSGDWRTRLARTSTGAFKADVNNARLVLENDPEWRGVLKWSDFSYSVVKTRPPPFEHSAEAGEWSDADTARLRCWLSERYGFSPKAMDADDAVLVAATRCRYHPVREYLNGLKWDGTDRLPFMFSDFFGADQTEYTALVGVKWMIGAVARVMAYPVKNDTVLILEGGQGRGKSTALRILASTEWFSDTHFELGSKDAYQQLRGVWIVEMAELDAFNKAESTRAKAFFSSIGDTYRQSYGRRSQFHARQCVIVGTTNQDHYLRDVTGNRRYWPVFCHEINLEALAAARDQLWAEAVHRYRQGERWWVLPHELHLFEAQQEERFEDDAWESLIDGWLGEPEQRLTREYTTADIMMGALSMTPDKIKPPEQKRVGQIMKRLGWKKKRRRMGKSGGQRWVFVRPETEML